MTNATAFMLGGAVGVIIGFALFLGMDAVVRRRLRLRWYSGLISPCRGYVYQFGKWHPRKEQP